VTQSDLDAFCLDHMARFKRPRAYRFIQSLPKNNYGKVLKTELRERLRLEPEGKRPGLEEGGGRDPAP
jgi:long-chain acyl-CoA synthetase